MIKKISIAVLLIGITGSLGAQVLYNNSGSIFVSNGGVLQVNGTAQNAGGIVENNGTTNILVDYVNDDITQGDGEYYVTGNWENNSVFNAQTSHVYLDGVNQLITGTAITSFYDLTTIGTGIKTQTIDSRVLNILDLTDRELATDANIMFVDNVAVGAITFTTGFVSSDPITGRLDRATNSTGVYIFPTGSSVGTLRYRPIEIQPDAATATRYEVRFANVDATTEGYDRTQIDTNICLVNPNWFHIIDRSQGTTDASVTIFYDPPTDGTWTGMAQWNATPVQWEDMGAVTAGTAAPFDFLTKTSWNDWNDEPYAITNTNPVFDVAGTDAMNCGANDGSLDFTLLSPNTAYTVTYDSAGVAIGPVNMTTDASGNGTINVGAGTYTNITVSDGTCDHTSSATIIINDPPTPAAPTVSSNTTYCEGDLLNDMTATSTGGTITWYSDPNLTAVLGTGPTWTPSATLGQTSYYITETLNGCESDTSTIVITINVCCDLTVSTMVTDETCDVLSDGAIGFTIGGTSTYDIIIDGNVEFSGVGAGAQNWTGQADGTYAVQVVDPNNTSCDTTFNITINPGATVPIGSETATDVTNCANPNGTITITSATATGYDLYDSNNMLVASNATGSFTGLDVGDYYVIVTDGTCTGQGTTLTVGDATMPSTNTINGQACDGSTYTFADGSQQVITGTVSYVSTLVNALGCDSLVTENITAVQSVTTVIDSAICEGTDYTSQGDAANFVNVLNDFTHTSTLTGASGCDSIIVENISVIPSPTIDLGFDFPACVDEVVTITATTNGPIPVWSTGDSSMSITLTMTMDSMIYATVTDQCGSATDTVNVTVFSAPIVDAGPDQTIPLGGSADLLATSATVPISYSWSPSIGLSCTNCPDPSASPIDDMTYIVAGVDENGCIGYDTVNIIIDGEITLYIPNIFSPNNDGENDLLEVYGPQWSSFKFQIFNRWGAKVFESEDPNVRWDGKHYKNQEDCPQAVFVYKLKATSVVGLVYERAGTVLLTR